MYYQPVPLTLKFIGTIRLELKFGTLNLESKQSKRCCCMMYLLERPCIHQSSFKCSAFGLLICTLISENQGLEKSNLRKISGPANLDFFSVCHLDLFQVYSINLAFFYVET